jgi:uncharacterized protein YdeI (YjbR/CyaY-like superfamily)
VEETIKWGVPHFDYKGPLCGVAAFKSHAMFSFAKIELVLGMTYQQARETTPLFCLKSVRDLPKTSVLVAQIKKAAALNDAGIKVKREAKPAKKLTVPPALTAALKKNKKARAAFDAFPPSHKREYAEWIAGAKGDDTRARRVASAMEWIGQGKSRNWKYE